MVLKVNQITRNKISTNHITEERICQSKREKMSNGMMKQRGIKFGGHHDTSFSSVYFSWRFREILYNLTSK